MKSRTKLKAAFGKNLVIDWGGGGQEYIFPLPAISRDRVEVIQDRTYHDEYIETSYEKYHRLEHQGDGIT